MRRSPSPKLAFLPLVATLVTFAVLRVIGPAPRPARSTRTTTSTATTTTVALAPGEWICTAPDGRRFFTGAEEARRYGGCHR